MHKLHTFLRQPFPFEISIGRMLLSLIGIGLFVSLFLVIFQPFGSGRYIQEGRAWVLWGYGFVTVLALMFDMLLLPRIFPGIFNETRWNVFKGILFQLWHIVPIGAANILFASFIGGIELRFSAIIGFLLITLSIGIFPIILGILSVHYFLLNKHMESTKKMNERIAALENQRKEDEAKSQRVIFASESGKEKLEIHLDELLFVKSIDNYVEVYRKAGDKIGTTLLRSSLKRIEESLRSYPFLFRCHRTYMINLNNISRVKGNSQGYKLIYEGVESPVPVSRSSSKRLLSLLA